MKTTYPHERFPISSLRSGYSWNAWSRTMLYMRSGPPTDAAAGMSTLKSCHVLARTVFLCPVSGPTWPRERKKKSRRPQALRETLLLHLRTPPPPLQHQTRERARGACPSPSSWRGVLILSKYENTHQWMVTVRYHPKGNVVITSLIFDSVQTEAMETDGFQADTEDDDEECVIISAKSGELHSAHSKSTQTFCLKKKLFAVAFKLCLLKWQNQQIIALMPHWLE